MRVQWPGLPCIGILDPFDPMAQVSFFQAGAYSVCSLALLDHMPLRFSLLIHMAIQQYHQGILPYIPE
jgi:hypothetical protein